MSHEITTTEMLLQFVSAQSEYREFMRKPFCRDEWVFATNGHIIVRAPRIDGIADLDSGKLEVLINMFAANQRSGFVVMPELPDGEKCPPCLGTGVMYKCPDCNGTGEFDHGELAYCCGKCDGEGQVSCGDDASKMPCFWCGGGGVARYQPVRVGLWDYDLRYLKRAMKLPGLKFAPPPRTPDDGKIAPAYFVFDGGEGLLMPMLAHGEEGPK